MGTFDYSSNSSSNLDAFYRNFYPKCVKESSINMNHMTINENDVNNIWECRHGCKNDPYLLMQDDQCYCGNENLLKDRNIKMETCNSCDENFSRCSELGAQCQENTPYKCGNPTSKLYSVYCNPSVENCRIHNISKPLISSQYHYVYFGCV